MQKKRFDCRVWIRQALPLVLNMKKLCFLLIILTLFLMPTVALADVGPKSSLDIYVKNAPQETYYLDLLVSDTFYMNAEYDSLDGDTSVSKGHHKTRFLEIIYSDYETMGISSANGEANWFLQLLKTYTATILIEGIILLLFGFKLKENGKPFLLVNLCTQIIMIVSLGLIMVYGGLMMCLLSFIYIEIGIITIKYFAYKKLLQREGKDCIIGYTVTASLFSMTATFIILFSSVS
ncbi:MAG: hypothetical protein ACOX8Q_06270 [Christensenellales bacterium]|jgi:hypothetical protein